MLLKNIFFSKKSLLIFLLVAFFLLDISLGSVYIPLESVINILLGVTSEKDTWKFIILDYRLPKAITSILVGSGLSVSGILMQTLFRNPLAGPFVLGVSSGASLGVALVIMGGLFFKISVSVFGQLIAAFLGSLMVLLIILIIIQKIYDTATVLIVGVMLSSLSGAVISILSFFTPANQLQEFIFWSLGSISNISYSHISIITVFVFLGISLSIMMIKDLNALLLGENYAKSLGVNLKKIKRIIIVITILLTGCITAFVGPIAFVGLAVPHMTRQIFKILNHKTLIIYSIFIGALLMLICDIISQWPFGSFSLPINAVTSLFGAPLVIWILLKKGHLIF